MASDCTTFCSTSRIDSPLACSRPIRANNSSTSRGERPSEGSSRISSFGRAHQPAADRHHLLLAAAHRARRCWRRRSRRRGKIASTSSSVRARSGRPRAIGAEQQVLAHREVGEHCAALRAHGSARRARSRRGRRRVMSLAVEADPCRRAARSRPESVRFSVVLPAPFAPSTRHDLARLRPSSATPRST